MSTNQENFVKLAKKIDPILPRIETIAGLTALTGLVLKSYELSFGGVLIAISLGVLSIAYYLTAFRLAADADTTAIKKFADKTIFWSLSVSVVGILFTVMGYNGSRMMLSVGFGSMFLSIIICLYMKLAIGRRMLIRLLIVAAIVFGLYFTPKDKLLLLGIKPPIERVSKY